MAALAVATSLPPSLRASRLHGSSSVCRQTELSPTLNSDHGGEVDSATWRSGKLELRSPDSPLASALRTCTLQGTNKTRGSGARGPVGSCLVGGEGRGGEGSESFLQLSRTALRSSGVPLSGPWESTGGSFHLGTQELTHAWVRMSPVAHQRSGLRDHR